MVIADDVQLPTPEITVYVVVALGVTVTLAAALGAVPELAVQTNGPVPDDDIPILCPMHIADKEGVILIAGDEVIETVAIADEVQVPTPDTTV